MQKGGWNLMDFCLLHRMNTDQRSSWMEVAKQQEATEMQRSVGAELSIKFLNLRLKLGK